MRAIRRLYWMLIVILAPQVASGLTVRSLGSVQYGGDLSADRPAENRTYTALRQYILDADGEVLPGTNTPTSNDLTDVDLFLWGRIKPDANFNVDHDTRSALRTFVQLGGTLLIETEADVDSVRAANDLLEGMNLGRPVVTAGFGFGTAGPAAGQFTSAVNPLTVGPVADLRGQTYGSTQTATISNANAQSQNGIVLGTNGGFASILEFHPFATGGSVIFMGNPLMTDQFNQPSSPFYSAHNLAALGNLLASLGGEIGTPPACDFNADDACDAQDIDLLSQAIRQNTFVSIMDLNDDQQLSAEDRQRWVEELKRTYFGDANLDGQFDSSDLVVVFSQGEYEDSAELNSGWADGDWNGDGEFNSSDLVAAFAGGGYDLGPRRAVAAVPETNAPLNLRVGLVLGLAVYRRGLFAGRISAA